jgi:NAD(P)-dependent dehydrogenase (short-subunit alcohol dehydrogenase family)
MTAEPLAGQSALVTGGARRIGRAIALALARAGADVALTYRTSGDEAAKTAGQIAALGRRSVALACDVRSESSVQTAVAQAVSALGRLDILVNNAAVFGAAPLDGLSLDQWDEVFETNARGPFLVAREALPHLRAVSGRIVNIESLGALHPWAGHAHYCASKAALHMLTQAMAKSFAPQVSVNSVAPGWIDFQNPADLPASQTALDAFGSRAAHFAAKTPMGRNGTPEEIAAAVLFFAAGPHFITGQTLTVDGGLGLV